LSQLGYQDVHQLATKGQKQDSFQEYGMDWFSSFLLLEKYSAQTSVFLPKNHRIHILVRVYYWTRRIWRG